MTFPTRRPVRMGEQMFTWYERGLFHIRWVRVPMYPNNESKPHLTIEGLVATKVPQPYKTSFPRITRFRAEMSSSSGIAKHIKYPKSLNRGTQEWLNCPWVDKDPVHEGKLKLFIPSKYSSGIVPTSTPCCLYPNTCLDGDRPADPRNQRRKKERALSETVRLHSSLIVLRELRVRIRRLSIPDVFHRRLRSRLRTNDVLTSHVVLRRTIGRDRLRRSGCPRRHRAELDGPGVRVHVETVLSSVRCPGSTGPACPRVSCATWCTAPTTEAHADDGECDQNYTHSSS